MHVVRKWLDVAHSNTEEFFSKVYLFVHKVPWYIKILFSSTELVFHYSDKVNSNGEPKEADFSEKLFCYFLKGKIILSNIRSCYLILYWYLFESSKLIIPFRLKPLKY